MERVRLVLYFPFNHPIARIEKEKRYAATKELIEFALSSKDQFEEIRADIAEIKNILLRGMPVPIPPPVSKKVVDADRELIKQFLDI